MKILFISPSYKPAYIYGGPVVVIALLAESLAQLGHDVTVYTTTANGKTELDVVPGQTQIVQEVKVIYFRRLTGDHTHTSPALWAKLNKTIKSFDVVHLHSWWNVLILGASLVCRKNNITPVISPHGMFSKYILETNNSGIKMWVQKIIGIKLLRKSILHVSTEMEWYESQKIVPGWEGRVIPNLVTLSNITYQRTDNSVFTIGFLSRIDPKKGLDILITALSKVEFAYKLLVAGSGDSEYIKTLKQMSEQLGNDSNIEWVGWKSGEEKFAYLAQLDLFALPSHSENFAIVVIESLSVGTPVLISDQVGLCKYVQENDYGWISTTKISDIANFLKIIEKDKRKAFKINNEAAVKIKIEYHPEKLAKEYIDFYRTFKNNIFD